MAAIPVCERVDEDQAVMVASGEFVGTIAFVGKPVIDVVKESSQRGGNLIGHDADIGLAHSKFASP